MLFLLLKQKVSMKRSVFMMSLSFSAIAATAASPEKIDTLSTYTLQGVQVTSTRATKTTPMAFATLKKSQINNLNYEIGRAHV